MSFISANEISTKIRGQSGSRPDRIAAPLLFSLTSRTSEKNCKYRPQLGFRLSASLARAARILPGDRVDVLFDPSNHTGMIRRVTEGGFAASVYGGEKKATIKPGQFYMISTRFSHYDGMPQIPPGSRACDNVVVKNEGIFFSFPEGTIFK